MAAGKKYLRCGCPACGNVITYPDYSAGGTSACEKCGKSVRLPAAPAPSAAATSPVAPPPPKPPLRPVNPPPKRRGFLRFVLWTLNLAVIAGVVIVVLQRQKNPAAAAADDQPGSTDAPAKAPPPLPVAGPTTTTNPKPPAAITPSPTNVVTITNVVTVTNNPTATTNMLAGATNPPAPPSATNSATAMAGTNSLAVLGLAIERPRGNKGSQLTYVTGVLQNQSDQKRFGVRIDLNLLDRSRNSVGTATDYAPVVEPRGTWRFRALVLDARAVGASVAGIREDR
jgi:hypothetical protein